MHGQAVEGHDGQYFFVVVAEGARGRAGVVLLLGLAQGEADFGGVPQLVHKGDHQPFGVGNQVAIAVAVARVAHEHRALLEIALRPVSPLLGGGGIGIVHVQPRVAPDGEDEAVAVI